MSQSQTQPKKLITGAEVTVMIGTKQENQHNS